MKHGKQKCSRGTNQKSEYTHITGQKREKTPLTKSQWVAFGIHRGSKERKIEVIHLFFSKPILDDWIKKIYLFAHKFRYGYNA